MAQLSSDVRMLVAVRVVAITSLLFAALLIQYTVRDIILPIEYLYYTATVTYILTLVYIVLGRLVQSRTLNLYIQMAGDLFVESMLVYFTGGHDSPFSFLYLVSIITASMLLYRRGGLIVASGAAILYGVIVDLLYYGFLPYPEQTLFAPTYPTAFRLYLVLAINFAGFYATAILTSFISETLRRTAEELRANRQNLAQLQALNENVVESIPSGLLALTPQGGITFVNPAAIEILQRPVGALLGRDLTEVGIFTAEEWQELSVTVPTNRIGRGEKVVEITEGNPRTIGYALTPLNTLEGKPAGLTLIFQDLTEMKRLEAQLRMKDRMAAVGELSAGIAHEIRNPLTAIAGSVQVLKSSTALSPQEQRLMSIILKESERLNRTIAEFLQFVKPQHKVAAEFDIAASIAETLDLLANSPELQPTHRIERDIHPPVFKIIGDPNQIRQVFWNMARNAVQAMPAGGTLRVSTEVDRDFYRIEFMDTGKGMSDADQRRLFQPFRTTFPSGTGLGMAISYRIVQEHGGRIDVDSLQGVGTRITIALPLRSLRTEQAVSSQQSAVSSRS
jgi:two-component system, NtrC family, sensor histidine kinase PilS